MHSIMKVLDGVTCRDSFGDDLIPYSAREMRLKAASHDLRMAIRCIRELSKTSGVSKAVWDAAWEWQAKSHKRWQHELDEMGRLSTITKNATNLVRSRRVGGISW
jgi:hypothetical protein